MSSDQLEVHASNLLECGMDFRENWLRHFRAAVDQEIAAAGGNVVAGRSIVAAKLEKGEQTIYQHYYQKSGKVYPTVEMMVLLEKKYANGRPPGWASMDAEPAARPAEKVEIPAALEAISGALMKADPATREVVSGMLANMAKNPEIHAKVSSGMLAMLESDAAGSRLGESQPNGLSATQKAA